jgi:carbon monoxide dehydrogenase subunit G
MNLESPKVSVQKTDNELFEFLADVKNFEQLMPENIEKFEVYTNDSFLFVLKGMPEIRLKVREQVPSNKIVLGSDIDNFSFTLTKNITKLDENSSEVQLIFEGKFNMMVAMMLKNPLQKFINTLTENIEKL